MASRTYTTRLRFEPGERVPVAGETFIGKRELSGRVVFVRIRSITRTFPHSTDGATLMDARVTVRDAVSG